MTDIHVGAFRPSEREPQQEALKILQTERQLAGERSPFGADHAAGWLACREWTNGRGYHLEMIRRIEAAEDEQARLREELVKVQEAWRRDRDALIAERFEMAQERDEAFRKLGESR